MNMKRLLTLFTASFLALTSYSANGADNNKDNLNEENMSQKFQRQYSALKQDIDNTRGVGTLKSGIKNMVSVPKHLYMSVSQGAEAMHAMTSLFFWPKVPILAAQSAQNLASVIFKAPLGITQTALGGTVAFTHQMIKHPAKTMMALGSAAALGYTLANHPDLAATAQIVKAATYTGVRVLGATSFAAGHLMDLWGNVLKVIPSPATQWMGYAMSGSATVLSGLSSLCLSSFGK